jgi:hypothetical protein
MSGYNHECEFCGKMSDDYPKSDCCKENIFSMEQARKFMIAYDNAENAVTNELSNLLYSLSAEEVPDYCGKIVLFIKELKLSHVKK